MPLKSISVWHKKSQNADNHSAAFQSAYHRKGEQAATLPSLNFCHSSLYSPFIHWLWLCKIGCGYQDIFHDIIVCHTTHKCLALCWFFYDIFHDIGWLFLLAISHARATNHWSNHWQFKTTAPNHSRPTTHASLKPALNNVDLMFLIRGLEKRWPIRIFKLWWFTFLLCGVNRHELLRADSSPFNWGLSRVKRK